MRVLAFDPGYERLGAAVVERAGAREKLVHSECIRTKSTTPFPERLGALGEAVVELIKRYEPGAIALETVYFEKNAKTAMQIAEVRGMLIYLAGSRGLPLYEYSPLQVKVAVTGNGRSEKKAVESMIGRLVALPVRKRLDDELDAIAVGLTCLASERYPHK